MKSVSLIGLGPMGHALATALLRHGVRITVWNRTAGRAEPLVQAGAARGSSPAAAAQRSDIVVVCVADYASASGVLRVPEVESAMAGKILVHLSTGSPREAREFEAWAHAKNIRYLDGAILVTPSQVGSEASAMLISGEAETFRECEPILRLLARNLRYVGEQAGAASAWDLAFLSHFFGGLLGFYHGARIMEAEGLPVEELGQMIAEVAPALGDIIRHDSTVIRENRFGAPESTLRNSATIAELILQQASEARIDAAFPKYATALFRQGLDAGYGNEDVAALIKILRQSS